MARTDTLPHFLTDVANAIREKRGVSDPIKASYFDNEIASIPNRGAYKVESIEEMEAITGSTDYEVCVVIADDRRQITDDTITSTMNFPKYIKVPSDSRIEDEIHSTMRGDDYMSIDLTASDREFILEARGFDQDIYIRYESWDGENYERVDGDENVDFGCDISFDEFEKGIHYFIYVGTWNFDGLYFKVGDDWIKYNIEEVN